MLLFLHIYLPPSRIFEPSEDVQANSRLPDFWKVFPIKPIDIDFAKVDTVFVGFPIWWHEEPAVIRTFLDNYGEQQKGKEIVPFCTFYESPMSEADITLKKGYPALKIRKGLRLSAKSEEIKKWIFQWIK